MFNRIKEKLSDAMDGLKMFFLPCEMNGYRSRILAGNFLIIFFFSAVFLKFAFAIFLYSFSNSQFYADITKTSLVELTNQERLKNNLPPLTQNPLLDSAAYMKAMDMVKNGYFNHDSPSGTKPWYWLDRSGYKYKYAGENLAIGFIESNEVSDAWMASPTHKANIVNAKYRDIGIAVLKANFQGSPVTLVVQMFGSKQGKSVAAAGQSGAVGTKTAASVNGVADKDAGIEAGKEVLGASVSAANKDSALFKLAVFFAEKYFGLVQMLVYGSIALVILLLVVNFLLKPDSRHVDLLGKALAFVFLMAVFSLIDQNLVVALVPHSLTIY